MLLNVRNTKGERVAIFDTSSTSFKCESDLNLERLVRECLEQGVFLKQEVMSEDHESSAILEKRIGRTDESFGLALKGFLLDAGYLVEDYDRREEEELLGLISILPEHDEHRVQIEKRLPNMSRLERTALIAALRS